FFENIFEVLFFDTDAVVLYGDEEVVFEMTRLDYDMWIWRIFEGIFEEVDHGQLQMGLIGVDLAPGAFQLHFHEGLFLLDQRLHLTESLSDEEIGFYFFHSDGQIFCLDGRRAKETFYLALQVFGLVADDGGIALEPVGLAGDRFLRQYIRGYFHDCERRLEFMCEIVDEVFLGLGQEFLPVEIEETCRKADQCEEEDDRTDDPEIHLFQYVFLPVGE